MDKFIITYSGGDNWDTVNSIVVEGESLVVVEDNIREVLLAYGLEAEEVDSITLDSTYFIRECEVDVRSEDYV